jgi:protein-disulfide isomerase
MKNAARRLGIFLLVIISWVSVPQFIYAEIDMTLIKQTNLDVQPLDIAASVDGKMIYVLARGEILVYSIDEDKVSNRIPIDKDFDKLTYAAKDNVLILTSSSSKTLKIIQVDFIYNIAIDGLPFKGPADAAVTIAVFDDYQWPYCARLEPFFQQVLDKYPNNVKLVVKNFPLPSHKFAQKAATAALAANVQGKFWEFHSQLFKNYNVINDAKIQDIAKELGLDMKKFNEDMQSPAIKSLIERDMDNGRQVGVRGTPTIFINGKTLRNRSIPGIYQVIEAELKKRS